MNLKKGKVKAAIIAQTKISLKMGEWSSKEELALKNDKFQIESGLKRVPGTEL